MPITARVRNDPLKNRVNGRAMDILNTPIGICLKCNRRFRITTNRVECGCTDQEQHEAAMQKLDQAIKENPELFKQAEDIVMAERCIQTPITTVDRELFVLYTSEKLSDEEISELSKLPHKQLITLLKIENFKAYKLSPQ